jgi:hypothetical protein
MTIFTRVFPLMPERESGRAAHPSSQTQDNVSPDPSWNYTLSDSQKTEEDRPRRRRDEGWLI